MTALGILFAQTEPVKVGVRLTSENPRFEVTLPDGYQMSEPRETPPRYIRASGREDWARISLVLAEQKLVLPQNPGGITLEETLPFIALPTGSKRLFYTVKWNDFDIPVVEYRAVIKDLPVIGVSAVLPLSPKAVTLTISAPDPLEKEVREDLKEVLFKLVKASTHWHTPDQLQRIWILDLIGKTGAVLLVLYPIVWIGIFRGDPMRGHWLRVAWLLVVAVLLFIPITSPGQTTMSNNLVVNAILPLALVSFVIRRIKLGIDMD